MNKDEIIGSPALDLEIEQIDNLEKQMKVKLFYNETITIKTDYSKNIPIRVNELTKSSNLRTLDKFHLSFAEEANADFLLTTDIKFEKSCLKLNKQIKVINPLKYLTEVILNEHNN